jgi:hypothetical protein
MHRMPEWAADLRGGGRQDAAFEHAEGWQRVLGSLAPHAGPAGCS